MTTHTGRAGSTVRKVSGHMAAGHLAIECGVAAVESAPVAPVQGEDETCHLISPTLTEPLT